MTAGSRLEQRRSSSFLDELTGVLGPTDAAALAEAFGGKQLYVPRAPGADHPITAAIGVAAAAKLADYWHGTTITVPATPARRALVLALAAQNVKPNAIAGRVHCSRSYVYKVLDEARRAADAEPDLFNRGSIAA